MNNKKKTEELQEKKIRKLYHLDPGEVQFVREYDRQKKLSESAVIRLSVRALQKSVQYDPFEEIIGSVEAGEGQAEMHDEVIYE